MTKENKSKIVFFADATCDMPAEFVKKNDIKIIGLRYYMGGEEGWFTTADKQSQFDDYYMKMRKGAIGSTSLVLYEDAIEAFEPYFKQGCDIIHFGLSSGLAKTYENALNAGTDLAKKYGRKFYAPDTKIVSAQNYALIRYAIALEKENRDKPDVFERVASALPAYYATQHAYVTVEDLRYLHKSGRLSGAAKLFGGMLNIKPLITVDENGKLVTFNKKTGRLQSIQYLSEIAVSRISPEHPEVFIIHAHCIDDAKLLEQKILAKNPNMKTEIINMGFIIGTHTGPGTLGCGFKE